MNSEFKPLGIGKNIYIYAEVDIDKAFTDILGKSKKIRNFLDANKFDYEFTENIRLYKNFVRLPAPRESASTARSRTSSARRSSARTSA